MASMSRPATPTVRRPSGRWFRTLAIGGLLLAIAYFAWRGVLRGLADSGDLAVGFSAGRAWLLGHDPYDAVVLGRDLVVAGGADVAGSGLLERLQNVYVPATLPAFAPLAVFSWPIASLVFLALNVAGSAFIAVGLGRLLGWRASEPRALALAALVLALAPVHTAVASGQTAILATTALLAAVLAGRRGHPIGSGLLYGLATVIKIQIGLPFVAYLVWRRRWLAASCALLLVAGAGLLAVARMQAAGVPWLSSWLANLAALSGPGGINDPSPLNVERFSLINLQVLLFDVVGRDDLVNLLTFALVGAAGLGLVWLVRGRTERDLLAVSVVAVLALLVAYHRYYDAVLLAFPIAWAVAALGSRLRREAIAVLVLSADFLLPFQTALHDLEQGGRLPTWLTGGPLWDTVLLAQHVWALVLLTVVLLVAAARARSVPASDQPVVVRSMSG